MAAGAGNQSVAVERRPSSPIPPPAIRACDLDEMVHGVLPATFYSELLRRKTTTFRPPDEAEGDLTVNATLGAAETARITNAMRGPSLAARTGPDHDGLDVCTGEADGGFCRA